MGASLTQEDSSDYASTSVTRLPVPVIDSMKGAESAGLPAGVTVVGDGAPPVANPGFKNPADCPA